jgi:hypothetical protein
MADLDFSQLKEQLKNGEIVPFLGMGVFYNTKATDDFQLPFDSDSMVLALNNGRAMSPRLMYEYTRAAMSLEQRKGRNFIIQMTNHIYSSREYNLPFVYEVLKNIKPKYLVDTNLDDSVQKIYSDIEHFLITGVSRISAEPDRYIVYKYSPEEQKYSVIDKNEMTLDIPVIFKPMGGTIPEPNFIISDADFVDWLTEAMGGYSMPNILKDYKKDKSYLFLGVDFGRDTYRMVANEVTLHLKDGIFVTHKPEEELGKKEKRFVEKHFLKTVSQDTDEFLKNLI